MRLIRTEDGSHCAPMPLVLVPIPRDHLAVTASVWLPLVGRIAKRSRNRLAELVHQIASGEVMIHLAWDDGAREARALAGTRLFLRGGRPVAELVWCTGGGRKDWLPLLVDLENYHREAFGCTAMNAVARFGWMKELKARGYRPTHVILEKEFA